MDVMCGTIIRIEICIPQHNCVLSLAISFVFTPVTLGLNQLIGLQRLRLNILPEFTPCKHNTIYEIHHILMHPHTDTFSYAASSQHAIKPLGWFTLQEFFFFSFFKICSQAFIHRPISCTSYVPIYHVQIRYKD